MTMDATPEQKGLRVAVLADIHGNIRALQAALQEITRMQPDQIVVCGDVASGPFPGETLEQLMGLGKKARFVRGNADREVVSAYDNHLAFDPDEKDPARLIAAWSALQINQRQRDFLASFQDRVVLDITGLGRVLFCHGTPHSDEEIITSLTPENDLNLLLAGTQEKVVVCGHTHHQFDRKTARYRVINAGSIGMPYEGKPGAFWGFLGPEVRFHRTDYDVERAVEAAMAAGYPDPSYRETILTPPKSEEVAAFFEKVAAERGERNLINLRPWSDEDYPLLMRLMGDPAMMEHLGGPESPEKIQERQQRYLSPDLSQGQMFVILVGPERAAAGSIGYWERQWRGETVWETGWLVLPEFQGQGIATRATVALVETVRAVGKHRFLHAFPAADNGPSNAICRKAGFTLLEALDFEYPAGHWMRCNDWRLDLDAEGISFF